ncbi:MAG: peptidyl-prolyl cis-trans isomerase [Clostridiales bacterium]|nr:peptidyl-prolyl cis-trans isomerase [Clostridiales bacterium]
MAKTSKSGKANKKLVSVGMTVAVVAIVLCVVFFFTYISGVLPRTLTGISITENLSDGTVKTVKNFNVLESNYHFVEVYDTYSQYGMVSADKLDEVCNEETGETYRDVLLREAATQMKTLALVERAAKENGFMEMSKAHDLAAANLTTLDIYGMMYGYGSGINYLKALYGTGMTKRAYTDFMAREILVEEYGDYLKQFDPSIVPTDAAIKAKYNEAPNQYCTVDYSSYFIKAETDKDGKVIGMDAAVASANKIAKATKDTATFRQAVIDWATEKKDDAVLATFADDANPCLTEGFTYSLSTYMDDAVRSYIFSESKAGDVKVIQTEFGAYIIHIAKKDNNDYATVGYRMLTLKTDVKNDATDAEKQEALQKTLAEAQTLCPSGMSPIDFYKTVKQHTTDQNSILMGGYSAQPATYFESTKEDPIDAAVVEAGKWLFDSARKQGDVLIKASADGTTVYVFYFEENRPAYEYTIKNNIIADNFNAWNTALEVNHPGYSINAGLCKHLIY